MTPDILDSIDVTLDGWERASADAARWTPDTGGEPGEWIGATIAEEFARRHVATYREAWTEALRDTPYRCARVHIRRYAPDEPYEPYEPLAHLHIARDGTVTTYAILDETAVWARSAMRPDIRPLERVGICPEPVTHLINEQVTAAKWTRPTSLTQPPRPGITGQTSTYGPPPRKGNR